jgi:ribosome maturation factor RimP
MSAVRSWIKTSEAARILQVAGSGLRRKVKKKEDFAALLGVKISAKGWVSYDRALVLQHAERIQRNKAKQQ